MQKLNRPRGGARVSLVLWTVLVTALACAAVLRADDLVPITVQLDWKPGMQFAGLLVAQERGWYRDAGLDVTIRANGFKRPYVDVVAEDDHTIGTSEARTLVSARIRGFPIRALATMFQASPVALVSLKSRGLRSPADFEGKTLGIHRPEDAAMLDTVFRKLPGERPFKTRTVGFDFKELLAGEVDAAPGYVMDEPIRLAQSGVEVNVLPLAEHGWVDYSQVLFTSERFLAKNPEAIKKFVAATFRGWRAVIDDPVSAADSVWEKYPAGLSHESARESLRRLLPLLTKESPILGTMRREAWMDIIERNTGDMWNLHRPDVGNFVDVRFQPEFEKEEEERLRKLMSKP